MGGKFGAKISLLVTAVLLCLDRLEVQAQQNRACGTEFDPSKIASFVASASSETQIKEMPWMVAIVEKFNPDRTHCSATLVSKKFIITAAHCFENPKEAYQVVLGTDNLNPSEHNYQKHQEKRDIFRLHKHPDYSKPYNDIAIIELEDEIKYNEGIYPICLPATSTPINNRINFQVKLVGYGSTGDAERNQKLRHGSLRIFPQRVCNNKYQEEFKKENLFNSTIFCAGSSEVDGVGSCGGDSGGPLLFKNYEDVEYWEQIAVIQGGDGNACGTFPGIYTRVDDPVVFDWIEDVLSGNADDHTTTTTTTTTITTTSQGANNPCNSTACGKNAKCYSECNWSNTYCKAICKCEYPFSGNPEKGGTCHDIVTRCETDPGFPCCPYGMVQDWCKDEPWAYLGSYG